MDNKNMTFSFSMKNKGNPYDVVNEKVEELNKLTNGYVTACIREYKNGIESLYDDSFYKNIATLTRSVKYNVQNDLGSIESEDSKYEVFFTVKGLDKYKYRLMFFSYGTISYPVKVVLESGMAEEIFSVNTEAIMFNTYDDFNASMNKLFSSEQVQNLVQSFIYEALRRE